MAPDNRSRREIVRALGSCAAWLAAATVIPRWMMPAQASTPASPGCVVTPEQTEGPYFVDEGLHRSDIRSDPNNGQVKPGSPFLLTLAVSRLTGTGCEPVTGAQVDIWHCDALGVYSDVTDRSFRTVGQKFLRGYQLTDAKGEVRFLTIYPGWYEGRTVHIHVKIRTTPQARRGYEFTSQLYFDDAFSNRLYTEAPYAARGIRTARNQDDFLFRRGGERLMVSPTPPAGGGYAAAFAIGLRMP